MPQSQMKVFEEAASQIKAAGVFLEDGAPGDALRCMLRADALLAEIKKQLFDVFVKKYVRH